MPEKWKSCVKKVKAKQSKSCKKKNYKGDDCYNPYAICAKYRSGKSHSKSSKGKSSKSKSSKSKSSKGKIHTGPRGGKYRIKNGKKVYVK